MRLDKQLVTDGFADTRAKAQDAIQEGRVMVNGRIVQKNSYDVQPDDQLEVQETSSAFASRAGAKLYDVLAPFQIDLKHRVVIDVGASTGGFSDVCLQEGAAFVYALDVGKDQLLPRLKSDPRIKSMEQTNCRYLKKEWFDRDIDFACMDVSFISVKLILPSLLAVMAKKELVVLIKPQFEAGKQAIGKHGVIRDEKVHVHVLKDLVHYVEELGLFVHHLCASSILGRDGNKEFVMHIKEEECHKVFPYQSIVKDYGRKKK